MVHSNNDIFVVMSIGNGETWQHEVAVCKDAGDYASWTETYSGRISTEELRETGTFSVTVKDLNVDGTHSVIGSADVNISPLFVRTNMWVEFDGDIKENRKTTGEYLVRLRYRDRMERPDKRSLHIRKISLSHIVHHGMDTH